MSRNVVFAPGEFYHLYNRGTEKRRIFAGVQDYERFLSLLYLANGKKPVDLKTQGRTLEEALANPRTETLVDVCAYALMPNHFHLLVHEHAQGGASLFMQKLTTGYTMYFNKKNGRNGALFQGKFKAQHVGQNDAYLKHLISYIHLNPVKLIDKDWKERGPADSKKAEQFLSTYPYSSYTDFCTAKERPERALLNRAPLPDYFDTPHGYKDSLKEWLNYKPV